MTKKHTCYILSVDYENASGYTQSQIDAMNERKEQEQAEKNQENTQSGAYTPDLTQAQIDALINRKNETQYVSNNLDNPFYYLEMKNSGSLGSSQTSQRKFIAGVFQIFQLIGIIGCISTMMINLLKMFIAGNGNDRASAKQLFTTKAVVLFFICAGVFLFSTIAKIVTNLT